VRLEFHIVDVFADRPFSGNQLAVVLDAGGLSDTDMRQVAGEFGFSETIFISDSTLPGCDSRVRIWTPWEEVPVAGHPLVGAALVLHQTGRIGGEASLESAVGPISIDVDAEGFAWMTQPPGEFGAIHQDPASLAAALSLDRSDIRRDLPVQVVSTGHEFVIAPIGSLRAMREVRVRLDAWDSALMGFPPFVYCFSVETEGTGVTAHCRLLAPHDIASGEDAASGSAAGGLGCYLWRYVDGRPSRPVDYLFEQGIEMGRPSRLRVAVPADGRQPRVGGQAAFVANGHLAFTQA
jgi:trans-2,3-dihydro-3-hydroxyanthranilate isomerase